MSVIVLEVPSRARMGYGIGEAVKHGVEFELLNDTQIELTSGDELRLERMVKAFQGRVVSEVTMKYVQTDLPRHEA